MDTSPILDSTGFPLLKVENERGDFYTHWMPVTKVQIEYFLSSVRTTSYTAEWYEDVMSYNERITPASVKAKNYWQAFVTGILPKDARTFASWLTTSDLVFDLPTQDEWQIAYKYFKKTRAEDKTVDQIAEMPNLDRRAKLLVRNISISLKEIEFEPKGGRTLADQMLMRMGVMEYVYKDDRRNTYGGYGQTNSVFFGSLETPEKGFPQRLINEEEGAQMRHYGFRLIARPKR